MNSSSKPTSSTTERTSFPSDKYILTMMDTNTKVTNSPLASVNPTAVPCPVNRATQSLSKSSKLYTSIPEVHGQTLYEGGGRPVILSNQFSNTMNSSMTATLFPQTKEVHGLSIPMEQQNSLFRPVIIAHNPSSLPTPGSSLKGSGTKQNSSVPSPDGKMLFRPAHYSGMLQNVLSMDNRTEGNAATTRFAQLILPQGPSSSNAQLLLYYPQSKVLKEPNKSNSPTSRDEPTKQSPVVYYALASPDILRHLQTSVGGATQDNVAKQHLIQTPSGLMLLQANAPIAQNLSVKIPGQLLSSSNAVGSITTSPELATLPRTSKPDHGLICTCPPEVHQAVLEHRKKLKQLQQEEASFQLISERAIRQPDMNEHASMKTQPIRTSECAHVISKDLSAIEVGSERGHNISAPNATSQSGTTLQCLGNQSNSNENGLRMKDKSGTESQTNYLITLFQALRASGVQPEAFKSAFERTQIPLPTQKSYSPKANRLYQTKLEIQKSIQELRDFEKRFRSSVTEDLKKCRETITSILLNYESEHLDNIDPTILSARADRASLDRLVVRLSESQANLGEQLNDLECVIEQTGNDVLQHRCRITLPYVQTLDNRLDTILRAVGSACVQYPSIQQRLSHQEDLEIQAISAEKKLLDKQLQQLEDIADKCKRIKGTILTLRRLAIVNAQNRQHNTSPRRFSHLGGAMNRAAADRNSIERNRLYESVRSIIPNSEKRMQAIKKQENLYKQRKRVLMMHANSEPLQANEIAKNHGAIIISKKLDELIKCVTQKQGHLNKSIENRPPDDVSRNQNQANEIELHCSKETSAKIGGLVNESIEDANIPHPMRKNNVKLNETLTVETSLCVSPGFQMCNTPTSILKPNTTNASLTKESNKLGVKPARGVMFSTTVTVDDGSEVVRLNCTLNESELDKHAVPPTEKLKEFNNAERISNASPDVKSFQRNLSPNEYTKNCCQFRGEKTCKEHSIEMSAKHVSAVAHESNGDADDQAISIPTPPPRNSSKLENQHENITRNIHDKLARKKDYENLNFQTIERFTEKSASVCAGAEHVQHHEQYDKVC